MQGAWQLVSVAMPTKLADTSEQTYLLVLLMGLGRQLEGTTTRNCNSPLATPPRETVQVCLCACVSVHVCLCVCVCLCHPLSPRVPNTFRLQGTKNLRVSSWPTKAGHRGGATVPACSLLDPHGRFSWGAHSRTWCEGSAYHRLSFKSSSAPDPWLPNKELGSI